MDYYPKEIIDHILYFTKNKVSDLSLVNKYFNNNVARIRITSNENYPKFRTRNLVQLSNITALHLERNDIIINKI